MFVFIKKRTIIFMLISILLMGSILFKTNYIGGDVKANYNKTSYIALVIDDLGNNGDGIEELIKLDIPITAAVMPFYSYSKIDAKRIYDANIEVMLHLPMEPEKGNPAWLVDGAILSNYSRDHVKKILKNALGQIKYARGINNHMGSKIMKDETIMREILTIAKEENLYFLNSKTDRSNIAREISQELDIVYFERNVFLDNQASKEYIEKAMKDLAKIAIFRGYAIGIGHIGDQGGKVTIEVISKMAKELEKQGIEFIYLSQLKDIVK